ncbi:GTPase activator [Branchiostoma belcheri]|nr:GTPase activator [Branchiostoma belcheri]
MNYQAEVSNSLAIRQEITRFESVHPNIYAIYDLLEQIDDPLLASRVRDHVVCIEGLPSLARQAKLPGFESVAEVSANFKSSRHLSGSVTSTSLEVQDCCR